MNVPIYAKVAAIVLGIFSLFWMPWIFSIIFMFLAGLVTPFAAFGLGILADLLYYPGHGWPWGVTTGLITAVLAAGVRHFVKTRII